MGDYREERRPKIVYRRRARSSAATAAPGPIKLRLIGPDFRLLAEQMVAPGSYTEWHVGQSLGCVPDGTHLHIVGGDVHLTIRAWTR